MKTYKITRTQEGYPSRTRIVGEDLTKALAQSYLANTEISWKRHGGAIIDRDPDSLKVDQGDGSSPITFTITQEQN